MLRWIPRFALSLLIVSAAAAPASASVIAYLSPQSSTQAQGASFQVGVYADFTVPQGATGLLGFGLDLAYDHALISLTAPPQIGPGFTAFTGPDGDGLGGIAASALPGGTLLLATLSFHADAPGVSALLLSVTAGDLTEGFALDPTGFDAVQFSAGQVTVVPEPGSFGLLGAALAALACARRRRGGR
jgi:hypothetical protein